MVSCAPPPPEAAAPTPEQPAIARSAPAIPVFDPDRGEFVTVPIHDRGDLLPCAEIPGPAVIVEDETSTVVGRSFTARIDASGYIEMTRNAS